MAKDNKRNHSARKKAPESPGLVIPAESVTEPPAGSRGPTFPIAGIGASAGGLAPFLEILRNLGDAPGAAIVFMLHQEKHESALHEVVARATKMPVVTIENGIAIESDHVYLGPPAMEVTIHQGRFVVQQRSDRTMLIDLFFRTLAEDQGSRAIGVVLSGSASDGALGTKAIKEEGGITFAQDESARFPQMPHAARTASAVDFVLSPADIARELVRVSHHVCVSGAPGRLPESEMLDVFGLLHTSHDIDFTHYKPSTVERRIRRRMALHKIDDLRDYVALLRENSTEVEQLYNDILIRVTGFFRDPEVFNALCKNFFPALIDDRTAENPVRVWVPGCATGEEVYSLAIALLETASEIGVNTPIQIFGTDVSDQAVDRARVGIYPENIVADISTERLRPLFHEDRRRISHRQSRSRRLRVRAAEPHQGSALLAPGPDQLPQRDDLPRIGAAAESHVHLPLRTTAERIPAVRQLGDDRQLRRALLGRRPQKQGLSEESEENRSQSTDARFRAGDAQGALGESPHGRRDRQSGQRLSRSRSRVLSRFSPPGVLINDNMEILQFRGRTSLYLEPPSGAASFNVLKMAREGLLAELRAAIHAARKSESPVRRDGVRVKSNGGTTLVNLEVIPFLTISKERYQLILFEELPQPDEKKEKGGRRKKAADAEPEPRQIQRLKRELESTREYLQSIIEEQEAMIEELRSANEEIQSSNEELQSTNEELETAKEELQSSNEELTTLNEELENRNQELAQANNDLLYLLASVDLPIVMLDSGLRIRRFNSGAQRVLNLIASDVGRSINDLKMTLMLDDLDTMIRNVIDSLEVRELEVQDRAGNWYSLRIRPYKTMENKIEGAVLVLIDLGQLEKSGSGRNARG